ncbi:MAG: hypothetical protein JW779_12160, partial [Candidatus Thorarchaeota archaeon]|nr:hypothetical protein [Candidatus Thorarchaeota archaeon]
MNTINQVLNQEVEMAGIATDSFIQTLVISGIIAVVVLIVAVALETRRKSDTRGFFSRKPVFIPGIIFIICAMLVITIGPAPMAQFYGINERQAYINADSNTAAFRVHDGMIYSHSMNVKATVNLVNLESLVIDLEFFIDDASVNTASLTINGSSFLTQETAT